MNYSIFLRGVLFGLLTCNIFFLHAQCPSGQSNNNGAGNLPDPCNSSDVRPSNWVRSGVWFFASGPATELTIFEVYRNNVLYQNSSGLTQTFIDLNNAPGNHDQYPVFGNYTWTGSGSNPGRICFYGATVNWNTPNNADWRIVFSSAQGQQCTYTVSGTGISLPVSWSSIGVEKSNGQVLINWSTASEQNTKDFEVQYSTNTNNWDPIGTVQAAGNSTTTKNYSFTHQSPLKNNTYNYYRILQRDIDGKFSYSKIVSIVFDEQGPDFLVYPNPADKLATIYLSEASEVSLVNSAGSVVWKSKLPSGRNLLPLEKYSAGVYILRAGKSSQRLVIQ